MGAFWQVLPSILQGYFSYHWAWLNIWYDKFVVLWTLNKQEKIYTIYICDTQSAQILQM